ncbi:MAG: site-specific DNA-methyltransferase [Muribaculaceae bacterium]|nr:site-specific DNA-methyltransferase [Muribaculaceae bacterium]
MTHKKHTESSTSSFGVSLRVGHDASQFYSSNLYSGISLNSVVDKEVNVLSDDVIDKIFVHSSEFMSEIPDNSIHLMITSPPYNVTKEYDQDLTLNQYLELMRTVLMEVYRVLINGGRACVNIANVGRKPYIPLADYISRIMLEIGFNYRGQIIWDKAASAGGSCAWGSWQSASNPSLRDVHEYILVFSKGDLKRKKGEDTIARDDFLEWTKSIWKMNTESARRVKHPAPFPLELPHRLINLYSFKDDIVLDPFMGSGTTAVAALMNGRHYVGYELNEEYANIARGRILGVGKLFG